MINPSIQELFKEKPPEVFDRDKFYNDYITLLKSTCKPGPIVELIKNFFYKNTL